MISPGVLLSFMAEVSPPPETVIAWSTMWPLRLTFSSLRVNLLCKTEIFDKSLHRAAVVFWCSYTAILFVVCTLSFLWPVQIQSESTRVEMCFCGWMNIALTPFFYCSPIFDLSLKMGVGFLSTCYRDLSFLLFSSGWSILCSLAVWSPKAIPFTGLITSAARCDMSWLKPHHFCCLCPWQGDTDDAVRRRRTPLGIVWCRVSMFSSPTRHPLQPCLAIFGPVFSVSPSQWRKVTLILGLSCVACI